MELLHLISEIVIIVAFISFCFLLKTYLRSYLNEKGRNFAKKADIGKITDEIEKVRINYASTIEKLKADLIIRNEQQLNLLEKRNEALIIIFDGCVTLLHEKLHSNPWFFLIDQSRTLLDYQTSIQQLFVKIFSDCLRLKLYYPITDPNDHVMPSIIQLMESTCNTYQQFVNKSSKFMLSLAEIDCLHLGNKSRDSSVPKEIDAIIQDYVKAIQSDVQVMHNAFDGYVRALNFYFNNMGCKTNLELFLTKK